MEISEVAYIAGVFDVSGHVACYKKQTKHKDRKNKIYNQWYIRCEIALPDKDVITGIQETLGFGWSKEKIYKKRPAHHKRQWRWSCGYRDALIFAKLMWPHAQVKLHKLEQIIDHYEPRAQELGDNVVDFEAERQLRDGH